MIAMNIEPIEVIEFKDVFDLNRWLSENNPIRRQFEILPVARVFSNPKTGLMVNTITYVVVLGYPK